MHLIFRFADPMGVLSSDTRDSFVRCTKFRLQCSELEEWPMSRVPFACVDATTGSGVMGSDGFESKRAGAFGPGNPVASLDHQGNGDLQASHRGALHEFNSVVVDELGNEVAGNIIELTG